MKKSWITARIFVAVLALGLVAIPVMANNVKVQAAAGAVSWQVEADNAGTTLVVHGKDGFVQSRKFEAGEAPIFQVPGDGAYRWQLVVQPRLSGAQKAELQAARDRGVAISAGDVGGFSESGYFSVIGGVVSIAAGDVDQGWGDADNPTRDQVIADDLIVQGSACVGVDCVNNENFGFDTIRLKENNLRIKFEDTSAGSFPSVDWQLTANDSASGGQNRFSIDDITNGKTPFTVEAAAASNSIYIDSTARVGFRTSNPVLDLHVVTGNTPGLRLEQDGSSGFTAQTWDLAGNEANFFLRDVTNGSKLPFRIEPNTPSNTLYLDSTGFVGIGTTSPSKKLHVALNNATNDTAFIIENNQAVRFDMINSNTTGGASTTWFFQVDEDANRTFKISKAGTGDAEVVIDARLNANGNTMRVDGSVAATSFVTTSTRSAKTDGQKVDPKVVLDKLAGLDIEQWRFKTEPEGVQHLGPYAEDFKEAFGLGRSDKSIELQDASGVALVAIQGLYQEIQELKKQNLELRERLEQKP